MKPELLINGWPLIDEAVGFGAYAGRLLKILMTQQSEMKFTPRVLVPSWMRKRLNLPYDVGTLAVPRTGKDVVDQAVWSQRLGLHAALRRAMLFSPVPFWSTVAPARSIVCQHDRIYHHFPAYLGSKFARRWLTYRCEKFLTRCAAVITVSEHSRRDLSQIPGLDGRKIHVIREGLPENFTPEHAAATAPAVRKKYRLPERYWLYVGGYDYRKNVEFLLEAYARAPASRPSLVLAGRLPTSPGPYCDVAGTLRRLALQDGEIITPGYIESSDMPGLYGGASLFIYPSRYEGFGLPPMEAMGCGCPSLCADNSSLPEIVRDTSYRFRDNDAGDLAVHLTRATQQPLPLNPSYARQEFDEDVAVRAHIKLFNSLVSS